MRKVATMVLCLALMVTSLSQTMLTTLAVDTPTISCESKECYPGDTVTVDVTVANNPGIVYLELTPTYSAALGTPTVKNGTVISDLTKGKQLVWTADEDVTDNGKLVSFTFTVGESVELGNYSVGFIFRDAYNYDEETVTFAIEPATIAVVAKPVAVTGVSLHKTATVKTGKTVTLTPVFAPENKSHRIIAELYALTHRKGE